jgi:hypothetical protein
MIRGSLSGFFAGLAAFYAILAGVRNCPGVTPTSRLKWWENWLGSEKPARAATCARERSPPPHRRCSPSPLDSNLIRILSKDWADARVFSSKWMSSQNRVPKATNCSPESRNPNDQKRENIPPRPATRDTTPT